jgi:hypothetical protein
MKRVELLEGKIQSTGVSLPATLILAARGRAKDLDRSVSWLMKEALANYLAEDTLKVYVCTGYTGRWQNVTASVIVASNETEARQLLLNQLEDMGLEESEGVPVHYVPTDRRSVKVLCDGDY